MFKKIVLLTLISLPLASFGYSTTYYPSQSNIYKHRYSSVQPCHCKNAYKGKHLSTCKAASKNRIRHTLKYKKPVSRPYYAHHNVMDFYLSGGGTLTSLKNATSVQINDSVVNDYVTNTTARTGGMGGIGLGRSVDGIMGKSMRASLALMGYYVGFNQIKGTEYPFINDDIYDTLDYKFKAESFAAMVESRITYDEYNFRPFLLLGLGASWNHLFSYSETPTNPSLSAAPIPEVFENNTSMTLAYEVGVGILCELPHKETDQLTWALALEYRYMNLGEGKLTPFPAETLDNPLKITNMNTQAVLLTLQVSTG